MVEPCYFTGGPRSRKEYERLSAERFTDMPSELELDALYLAMFSLQSGRTLRRSKKTAAALLSRVTDIIECDDSYGVELMVHNSANKPRLRGVGLFTDGYLQNPEQFQSVVGNSGETVTSGYLIPYRWDITDYGIHALLTTARDQDGELSSGLEDDPEFRDY